MNAYANENLMMPAHYVDMSEKEMEYEGGWGNFIAGLVCAAASVAFDVLGDKGIIDSDVATACS